MNLSKSQKVWIGLLGIGVGALVLDRALAEESTAGADAIESITSPASGTTAASTRADAAATPSEELAGRLRALAVLSDRFGSMRDAFLPPPQAAAAQPDAVQPDPSAAMEAQASLFAQRHVLRGILHAAGNSQAWIDGRIVEVGQTLEGARLLSAEGMTAVFEVGSVRVSLSLPDANAMVARKPEALLGNFPHEN